MKKKIIIKILVLLIRLLAKRKISKININIFPKLNACLLNETYIAKPEPVFLNPVIKTVKKAVFLNYKTGKFKIFEDKQWTL